MKRGALRSARLPGCGSEIAIWIWQGERGRPRTYDIARNQGSITTRNGNNSRTQRLLGKSRIE
eukprot:COSAG02_NODE_20396_length_833_cov_3.311989_1_plen_62_part_01